MVLVGANEAFVLGFFVRKTVWNIVGFELGVTVGLSDGILPGVTVGVIDECWDGDRVAGIVAVTEGFNVGFVDGAFVLWKKTHFFSFLFCLLEPPHVTLLPSTYVSMLVGLDDKLYPTK